MDSADRLIKRLEAAQEKLWGDDFDAIIDAIAFIENFRPRTTESHSECHSGLPCTDCGGETRHAPSCPMSRK